MEAIGEILQSYVTDQKIPLLGFGAKLQGKDSASHCFALNGDLINPEVENI
jgi:hypothetical protein